jgi:hypothetical protein
MAANVVLQPKQVVEQGGSGQIPAVPEARLSLLEPGAPELAAQVRLISGDAAELLVGSRLTQGTLLKIEWGETLLLGEVRRCQPVEGNYALTVKVEHALRQTADLLRLSRSLSGEDPSGESGDSSSR